MRRKFLLLSAITLLFAGCTPSASHNQNMLLQSQRSEELEDTVAGLIINKDEVSNDPTIRSVIDAEIIRAKHDLAAVEQDESGVMMGSLIPVKENVQGTTIYNNDTLYLSSDFYAKPGISLHLYLSTVVDPREVVFPDITAIDLGVIDYPYGAMTIQVPHQQEPQKFRTLVVWDKTLKRLYGFGY